MAGSGANADGTWVAISGGPAAAAWADRLLAAYAFDPADRPPLHEWAVHQVLGHLCLMLALQDEAPSREWASAIEMAYEAAARIVGTPDGMLSRIDA